MLVLFSSVFRAVTDLHWCVTHKADRAEMELNHLCPAGGRFPSDWAASAHQKQEELPGAAAPQQRWTFALQICNPTPPTMQTRFFWPDCLFVDEAKNSPLLQIISTLTTSWVCAIADAHELPREVESWGLLRGKPSLKVYLVHMLKCALTVLRAIN